MRRPTFTVLLTAPLTAALARIAAAQGNPWGDRINDPNIWNVVNCVRSLAKK
jgi:hypothetical protein